VKFVYKIQTHILCSINAFRKSFRLIDRGGAAVAQWLRYCITNGKVAGLIPADVSGFFIDIISFRLQYGPGVDSASSGNEYQEYFLEVKLAGT